MAKKTSWTSPSSRKIKVKSGGTVIHKTVSVKPHRNKINRGPKR